MIVLRNYRHKKSKRWILKWILIGFALLAITGCTAGCWFANANYSCPQFGGLI